MNLVKCNENYWQFIRKVRFDEDNVNGFVTQKVVTQAEQVEYMKKYNDCYWVCLIENKPVGFVGIVDQDIRVAVSPYFKGEGIGTFMINAVKGIPNTAKILKDNIASFRLFTKCGYKTIKEDETFYYLIP